MRRGHLPHSQTRTFAAHGIFRSASTILGRRRPRTTRRDPRSWGRARPNRSSRVPGGGPASRGCRTSTCRTSGGGRCATCRRRPSRQVSLAQIRIRSGWPAVSSVTSGSASRASASSTGSPTWRWSTLTPSGAGTSSMTWRACSARLTSSSASAARRPMLGDGVGDLAEGRPDGVDALEVAGRQRRGRCAALRASAVGALEVDHAAVDEPGERDVERRELLDGETILGVVGVQEVEGGRRRRRRGRDPDGRSVGAGSMSSRNHITPIDRLRARGYSIVTDTRAQTGYAQKQEVPDGRHRPASSPSSSRSCALDWRPSLGRRLPRVRCEDRRIRPPRSTSPDLEVPIPCIPRRSSPLTSPTSARARPTGIGSPRSPSAVRRDRRWPRRVWRTALASSAADRPPPPVGSTAASPTTSGGPWPRPK